MALLTSENLTILLILCGIFAIVLGLTHIVYPQLFHYKSLIFTASNLHRQIEPFKLWPIVYPLDLKNLYGIIWTMNFHVSFVLISIGFVEIFYPQWLLSQARYLIIWFAAWWFLRATCQLLLGRKWYDWGILVGFAVLGAIHVGMVLASPP